ncbi:hypothetical protein SK128_009681, partial [Halocaridina rubra]
RGDVRLHSRGHDLGNFYSYPIRVAGPKAVVIPWKVKEKVTQIFILSSLEVPKAALSRRDWWWGSENGRDRDHGVAYQLQ